MAVGALLFAGTLAAHGDAWWPGLIGGAAAAALGLRASGPVVLGARSRLPDRAAREALTIYLDAAALLLAALVALLHPLGYVLLILLAVLLVRTRQRAGEKYAGLRILGRGDSPQQARPLRDRRDGARDARARGRRRRRADARDADRARPLHPRLRRRVPLGHPRLRRLDRHRCRARTST